MVMEKRGWVRIVEAVVAILIITGIALTIFGNGYLRKSDESADIYEIEKIILREIELDDSLRADILGATIEGDVPQSISNKIDEKTPNYLDCASKICSIGDACILENEEENIYAKSVIISSNLTTYNPRQLKIFCWKEN